jgi:hypothetical protein
MSLREVIIILIFIELQFSLTIKNKKKTQSFLPTEEPIGTPSSQVPGSNCLSMFINMF